MRYYSHLHEIFTSKKEKKRKREHRNPRGCRWRRRISVSQGVGLRENRIWYFRSSTAARGSRRSDGISLGWKTEDFLIWIPPLASHVPCRDKKGGNAKRRKRNSARGRRKLSEASRLNYLSRGPVFLDLLSLIRSPPWKRRKFHFVAQRGGCSKGGEARDSSRSAFNWWLFLRGGLS